MTLETLVGWIILFQCCTECEYATLPSIGIPTNFDGITYASEDSNPRRSCSTKPYEANILTVREQAEVMK